MQSPGKWYQFPSITPAGLHLTKMTLQNLGTVKIAPGTAILTSTPFPKLRDDYLLVKTMAVTLNPADWQTLDEAFKPGTHRSLLGCDSAGIVIEVSKNVTRNCHPQFI
jgi:NADPH:quinone reductase-like Zn-dependent oxidoreductase